MKIYKSCWYDHKPEAGDNNNGLIYGVEWYDDNDNFLDIEWFATAEERDREFGIMKIHNEIEKLGFTPETVLNIVHDIWNNDALVKFALDYLLANVQDAFIDGYEDDITEAEEE